MAFDAVDVRAVMQCGAQECTGRDNGHCLTVEADLPKQIWANSGATSEPAGSLVCNSCRHRHCRICEEWSAGKEYSDYWICHCCGALTHRLTSWN